MIRMLLLSVVNTKLRDYYPSLDALCEDIDVFKRSIDRKNLKRLIMSMMKEKISLNRG